MVAPAGGKGLLNLLDVSMIDQTEKRLVAFGGMYEQFQQRMTSVTVTQIARRNEAQKSALDSLVQVGSGIDKVASAFERLASTSAENQSGAQQLLDTFKEMVKLTTGVAEGVGGIAAAWTTVQQARQAASGAGTAGAVGRAGIVAGAAGAGVGGAEAGGALAAVGGPVGVAVAGVSLALIGLSYVVKLNAEAEQDRLEKEKAVTQAIEEHRQREMELASLEARMFTDILPTEMQHAALRGGAGLTGTDQALGAAQEQQKLIELRRREKEFDLKKAQRAHDEQYAAADKMIADSMKSSVTFAKRDEMNTTAKRMKREADESLDTARSGHEQFAATFVPQYARTVEEVLRLQQQVDEEHKRSLIDQLRLQGQLRDAALEAAKAALGQYESAMERFGELSTAEQLAVRDAILAARRGERLPTEQRNLVRQYGTEADRRIVTQQTIMIAQWLGDEIYKPLKDAADKAAQEAEKQENALRDLTEEARKLGMSLERFEGHIKVDPIVNRIELEIKSDQARLATDLYRLVGPLLEQQIRIIFARIQRERQSQELGKYTQSKGSGWHR